MEDATRIKYTSDGLVLRSIPSGTEYPLQGEMLVGREVECAITLASSHASRYHAKINVSTHGVYIEDLHSTNGTYINGKKTRGRIRLSIGDEVTFDDLVFRFASLNSGAEDATVLSAKRPTPIKPTIKEAAPKLRNASVKGSHSLNEQLKKKTPPLTSNAINDEWVQEEIETPDLENLVDDSTQMISSSRMEKLIERNKNDISVNIGSGPRLIVMTAPLRGKLFEFDEALVGSRWQIGRSEQSNIFLNDKTISSEHAVLIKTPQGFTLTAIHAKNGVIINGIKNKQVLLKHNDKIQIGRTELLFRTDEPSLEPDLKNLKPYVELQNHRFAIISTVAVAVVIVAAYFLT